MDVEDRLKAAWHAALDERVPRASWAVLEGERVLCAHEPDRWYSSASMIKTFVAAVALDEVEQGRLSLGSPTPVTEEQRTDGSGVLNTWLLPIDLPLLEIVRLTIALSDNTATNALLAALGGPEVLNERLESWGYGSRMNRAVGGAGPMWSGAEALKASAPEDLLSPIGLGMTSVWEHHRLLSELAAGTRLPVQGTTLLALLAQQQTRAHLARYVGESILFAHKCGEVDGVRHDAGLLRASNRTLLVGCFTDGGPEPEWVDHPASIAMGLAMAWTAEILDLDIAPPPGVPPCPV